MQVYTKILIGMFVGIVLGVVFGPASPVLEADTYRVTSWDSLELRLDRDDPDSAVHLPPPPAGGIPGKLHRPVPLLFEILDVERESVSTAGGKSAELPTWSHVELELSEALLLRDRDGSLQRQLEGARAGDRVELWLKHEHIPLDGEEWIVQPTPISGLGHTLVGWVRPVGDAFLRLIKMVIVPLVFASLLVGVASLGDMRRLGRLGVRTLALYLATTSIAVGLGLLCANLLDPGGFIDESSQVALQAQFQQAAGERAEQAAAAPTPIENLLSVIPENPIESLVTGDMLQVIFFAVLFGVALTMLPTQRDGRPVVVFMARVQDAMVLIIHIVMKTAPYGVAALVADVVGTSGLSVLKGLMMYAVVVLVGLALHTIAVYGPLVHYGARISIADFLRAIRPAQLIAFSTSSSSAALPVTMECAQTNLGISKPVSSFVLPLGSTINMDGTALYQGVAAVFIAQAFKMDLTLGQQAIIVLTATMASIGAAGVPGAGMITLAMVLTAVGIPTVGVALILGVDRLLDMFRTVVNVTGDLAVTAAVARLEGESLDPLSEEEDVADPDRGFENRLLRSQHPVLGSDDEPTP